jgi:hypothetical protein
MITNTITLLDPSGVVVCGGQIVGASPLMLEPSVLGELSADFTTGLVAGSALAAVLFGFRYVKKALGWVDGGGE